jgi:hypothetical protein
MPIQQVINFVAPEGKPMVSMNQWVLTLTAEEQAAYKVVFDRQEAILKSFKDSGDLTGNSFQVIWVHGEKLPQVSQDPEWREFFDRYLAETGMTVQRTSTEV